MSIKITQRKINKCIIKIKNQNKIILNIALVGLKKNK